MLRDAERERADARAGAPVAARAAVIVLVLLEALRALVPFMDGGYRNAVAGLGFRGVLAPADLLAFAAGALVVVAGLALGPSLARRARGRATLVALAAVILLARGGVSLAGTGWERYGAGVILAAALGVAFPLLLAASRERPWAFGGGALAGLALDLGARALGASADVTLDPTRPLAGVLVALALAGAVATLPGPAPPARFATPSPGAGATSLRRAVTLGLALFLASHYFLAPATLARWTATPYAAAAAVAALAPLGALALAAAPVAGTTRARLVALAPLVALLPLLTPWSPAPLLLAVALAGGAAVAWVVADALAEEARAGGRLPLGVAVGVAFVLAAAYDAPFGHAPRAAPFGDALYALALVAGAVGLAVARLGARAPRAPARLLPGRPTRAALLALLLVLPPLAPLALPAAPAATPGEAARPLVVATFNVHQGIGPDGLVDWEAIAAALRALDPDVVAVQEVDAGRPARGGADGLVVLERALGMEHAFAPTMGRAFGNGVLSRFPILDAEAIPLPSVGEPRIASRVRLDLGEGAVLDVYSTHLAFTIGERQAQGATLARRVTEGGVPAIVGGDFNPWGVDAAGLVLESVGMHRSERVLDGPPPPTFTVRNPRASVDYVYATPDLRFLSHRVGDARVSDHFPVVATLEFAEAATGVGAEGGSRDGYEAEAAWGPP